MKNHIKPNKKPCHNEQGYFLLGTVLLILFLSIIVGAAMMRTSIELSMADQMVSAQQAFYAAESGVDRALFELRRNPNWYPGQGTVPAVEDVDLTIPWEGGGTKVIGYYSVEVVDGGVLQGWDTRWVRSVGRDESNDLTRVIFARILIANPSRFLVSTLGDLRIQSGANLSADVLAKSFYFEVDTNLPEPLCDIEIDGDVLFLRDVTPADPEAQFPDQVTITGNITYQDALTFAGVDIDRYRELARDLSGTQQAVYREGNLTVDLDHLESLGGGGSDFAPLLIYASGDVTISGTYGHSLLVVSGGDVRIDGDIVPEEGLAERPQIGVLAKQDLLIPEGTVPSGGNLSIEAFLMADGGDDSDGVFLAEGPKSVLGTLELTGAISVRGKGRTAIDLNAFQTRQLNFNPDLSANRRIPFIPFIANVINWREATLNDVFPPP